MGGGRGEGGKGGLTSPSASQIAVNVEAVV